jgi:hypothetical protein
MAGSPGIHDVEYTKDPLHLLGELILGSGRPQYDRLLN